MHLPVPPQAILPRHAALCPVAFTKSYSCCPRGPLAGDSSLALTLIGPALAAGCLVPAGACSALPRPCRPALRRLHVASSATATVANGVAVHSVAVHAEKPAAAPAGARLSAVLSLLNTRKSPLEHSPALAALALPGALVRGSCLCTQALHFFALLADACVLCAAPVDGPVCVVTGSSRGIGKAIALALGAAGARVCTPRTSIASLHSARTESPVLLSPATSTARKPEVACNCPLPAC